MKTKSRFICVCCIGLIIIISCTYVLRNYGKLRNKIVHRETLYGKFCIEENICKNESYLELYTYIRQSNFYDLIDSDINGKTNADISETFVPDIVHYTWYGGLNKGNTFRFHHLLSMLSVHKFVKPNRIYFWHDTIPIGPYWEEVREKVPELCIVFRKAPTEIRGKKVVVANHITDVVRLEAVMEYGGIYFDLDVMVLRSLNPLMKYDVTMGYESPGRLSSGIIIGKPWAEFFKLWHKEYGSFTSFQEDYHSVELPAMLAKRYPNLIHTEESSLNRPNWHETEKLYDKGCLYDWRRNNYAVHLWVRYHNIEHNAEDIKVWNTTVGEIFRWIYYGDWRLQVPGCILGNICKEQGSSRVFDYKRRLDFLKKIDIDIDFNRNIVHQESVIPSTVHFTWYGSYENSFRFHHFIAIMAAQKFISPDVILFWHETIPEGSYWEEVLEMVPEIVLVYRRAPTEIRGQTISSSEQNGLVGLEAVMEYGGIFIDLDVIVLRPLDPLLKYDVTMGYVTETELCRGLIIAKPWADFLKTWHQSYKTSEGNDLSYHLAKQASVLAHKYPNLVHTEFTSMNRPSFSEPEKLYSEGKLYSWRGSSYAVYLWIRFQKIEYTPQTIKYWNTTAGEIFRYIYYGDWNLMITETKGKICIYGNICKDRKTDKIWKYIRLPTFMLNADEAVNLNDVPTDSESVVPKIVHFTWYGGLKRGNHFRFHHMLAILAAHKFIKPDIILFWHDMEPDGRYWKETNDKVPNINLVYRLPPNEIRGRQVIVAEHITDVVRLEAIMEYGGMYFDLDAMVVKSLDPLLKYDVTMGFEHPEIHLCNGVIIAKPWAKFLRIWHREYNTFDDSDWGYHSVVLPATIAKQNPSLIHTEEESMHRPNIQEFEWLFDIGKLHDWRTKNYVVHLWIRQHHVEHNATDIKTWNTTVGEIMRYIYYDDWRIVK